MLEPPALLLAHAGHWTVWILYAIPLIAVLAAIPIASRRAKAAASRTEGETDAPAENREPAIGPDNQEGKDEPSDTET